MLFSFVRLYSAHDTIRFPRNHRSKTRSLVQEQHLQPILCSAIAEQLSQSSEGEKRESKDKDEDQRLPPALERLVTQ